MSYLQWVNAEQFTDPGKKNSCEEKFLPDPEIIESLRRFANMGYLKGVMECIELLQSQHQQSVWVYKINELAEKCDLDSIVRAIGDFTDSKDKVS